MFQQYKYIKFKKKLFFLIFCIYILIVANVKNKTNYQTPRGPHHTKILKCKVQIFLLGKPAHYFFHNTMGHTLKVLYINKQKPNSSKLRTNSNQNQCLSCELFCKCDQTKLSSKLSLQKIIIKPCQLKSKIENLKSILISSWL